MKNQRLAAIGIRRKGEPGFTVKSEEKQLSPGEYSIESFKRMYPDRYQDLMRCGIPSLGGVKITVMS